MSADDKSEFVGIQSPRALHSIFFFETEGFRGGCCLEVRVLHPLVVGGDVMGAVRYEEDGA